MLQKDKAVRLAKETLEKVWDGTLPVRPDMLADRIRLSVTQKNGEKTSHTIRMDAMSDWDLQGASGLARFAEDEPNRPFVCVYNADEHQNRRRFTMAHELGHVMLGHVKPGVEPRRDMTFNAYGDPIEIAANAYAAELLMPENMVRKYVDSGADIKRLASIFGVSTSAITNRLKNLGIA